MVLTDYTLDQLLAIDPKLIILAPFTIPNDIPISTLTTYGRQWKKTICSVYDKNEKNGGPVFKFLSLPWKRAQLYVKTNTETAIIPLTRTSARENQYKWIVKLVANKVRLTMAKMPKMKVSRPVSMFSISNFLGLRIGIIRASAIIPTCKMLGFKYLEEANNAEMNVRKLSFGRIDAMIESQWVDNYLWKQIGEKEENLITGPSVGDAKYIYLAANLDFPDNLTETIRNAMNKVVQNGGIQKILNSWQ